MTTATSTASGSRDRSRSGYRPPWRWPPWRCCSGEATSASGEAAAIAAAVGLAGIALPFLLGLFGADYLDGRNLIPVFVPLIVLLGAGFGVRRAGWAGIVLAGAFCLCGLVFTIEIDRLSRLQREDLRSAAQTNRTAAAGHGRRHRPLLRQPAAALLPRRPLRRGAVAAAAPDRPGWLGERRAQRPASPSRGLPPGRIEARLLRLHPRPLPLQAPDAGATASAGTRRAGRQRPPRLGDRQRLAERIPVGVERLVLFRVVQARPPGRVLPKSKWNPTRMRSHANDSSEAPEAPPSPLPLSPCTCRAAAR